MKKILMVLVVLGVSMSAIASEAVQHRVLLHGTQSISPRLSVAGWVIFPDIRQGTGIVVLAGPRIDFKDAWIELLGGITPDDRILIDTRFFSKHLPIHFWGEIQGAEDGAWYEFLQADLPIQFGKTFLGKIGMEIETSQKRGMKSQVGFGPHIIIPISKMTVILAHQWKEDTEFFRIYTVLDF
jgi:hypothetical protein